MRIKCVHVDGSKFYACGIGYGDSTHEVIDGVKLNENGELHRFSNSGGVPMSAIYTNGIERFNCNRECETDMITKWNQLAALCVNPRAQDRSTL